MITELQSNLETLSHSVIPGERVIRDGTMTRNEVFDFSMAKILSKGEAALRNGKTYSSSLYACDGAFPGYTNQQKKVLVIGREAYGDYSYYRQNKSDDLCISIIKAHLSEYNSNNLFKGGKEACFTEKCLTTLGIKYHARIIATAYAIITGDWSVSSKDIKDIAASLGQPNGISFAYANFSKLLNTTGSNSISTNIDKERIRFWAMLDNDLHILQEEVELLDPDIIITQGFIEMCGNIRYNCFNNLGKTNRLNSDRRRRKDIQTEYLPAVEFTLDIKSGKKVPILDVPHFSGIRSNKDWEELWTLLRRYFGCTH